MGQSKGGVPLKSRSIATTLTVLAAAAGYRGAPENERIRALEEPGSKTEGKALLAAYFEIKSAEVRQAVLDVLAAARSNSRSKGTMEIADTKRRA